MEKIVLVAVLIIFGCWSYWRLEKSHSCERKCAPHPSEVSYGGSFCICALGYEIK